MANKKNTSCTGQPVSKTRKYIVEAPEPKEGQKISSGGIRENGKLAVQFKNPVPYEEPHHLSTSAIVTTTATNIPLNPIMESIKREARKLGITIVKELASKLWTELGKPYLESKLSYTADSRTPSSQEPHTSTNTSQDFQTTEPKIDRSYADDLSEKIIHFPKERVG